MEGNLRETTDHDEIRRWAEGLGGKPQLWDDPTAGSDPIGIRIDFPGGKDDEAIPEDHRPRDISWDAFFRYFDARNLIFEYQPEADLEDRSLLYRFKPRWD